MAKEIQVDWKKVLWTSLIAVIPYTVINQIFALIERSVDREAHSSIQMYFAEKQPDYYPLLFMLILFFAIFAVITVYSMVQTRMSSNWISRGMMIGVFMFFVADLPYVVYTANTTVMPAVVARGVALTGLLGNVANGCLIAYIYMKLTGREEKEKR